MGKVEKFEDLIAWQKARELTKNIYKITRKGAFAKDFGLTNQMQRASVSIMSNIAEGFERGSPADYHRFLRIATASCAELRSQLYIAYDVDYINQQEFDYLMGKAREVGRILRGLASAIRKNK